jgi:hypothetical protein
VFQAIEGRHRAVRDDETGVEISLQNAPDYQYWVNVSLPDGRRLGLSIAIEPKFPDQRFPGRTPSYPMVEILMGTLQEAAVFCGKSREENTRFVRLILEGLSTVNRIWPFSRSPYFYSDAEKYIGREAIFDFELPSEDEIAKL